MRLLALALLLPLVLAAGPARRDSPNRFDRLRGEAAAAQAEARRLELAARRSRDKAAVLELRQAAAAAAIGAAEARISAAELEHRRVEQRLERHRALLAEQQSPNARLLSALIIMGRRPPLLAIAEQGSTSQFVAVRLLLDSTLPLLRRRTAALAAEIESGERHARDLADSRQALARDRQRLDRERKRFVALERQLLGEAEVLLGRSFAAGDVALARGEDLVRLADDRSTRRAAVQLARELALLPEPPPRPLAGTGRVRRPPLDYALAVEGVLIEGLGEISPVGIRSRGLKVAARRGAKVVAPADGRVAFAGPFRSRDGVVIIDHGGGWMTLLTGVAASVPAGARVGRGEPLGRAIGEVGIELSRGGRPVSAALIAGSSSLLSNARQTG